MNAIIETLPGLDQQSSRSASDPGRSRVLPGDGDAGSVRQVPRQLDLTGRFRLIRAASMALAEPLAPEDYVVQSMPDTSPVKWHLAHTSWFFEEFVLQRAVPGYQFHDEKFRFLFNSYYNSAGPMHSRPQRGLLSRPTVEQVMEYRRRIDERMTALCQRDALPGAIRDIIVLGLNHEQQHQELLLTDVKHLFSCNPLLPAYARATLTAARPAAPLEFQRFDGGLIESGHRGAGFCFDNELPRHRIYTGAFCLANRAVTNGEYLEFVRARGYREAIHWLSDGWAGVQREGWQRPLYWTASLEQEFTLTGLRALDPASPVSHLSYYEADAFARWAGARLPTEVEWELACAEMPIRGNFVESGRWHPEAPARDKGLLQMFGDVWEWTQSPHSSYPGFEPAAGALGEYNGKFMVNQLVLRGGSCATSISHIRPSYRNFFPPAARWQFSGLRLARDV